MLLRDMDMTRSKVISCLCSHILHRQLKEAIEILVVILQCIVLSHPGLHFGKGLLDRVEIGGIRG